MIARERRGLRRPRAASVYSGECVFFHKLNDGLAGPQKFKLMCALFLTALNDY